MPVEDSAVLQLRDVVVTRIGNTNLSVASAEQAKAWSVSLADLTLREAEVAALVGPSGCGKTSLVLGWTGLLRGVDCHGDRRVLGQPWPAADTARWRSMLAQTVTLIPQDAKAALDPLERIGAQIEAFTKASVVDRNAALRGLGIDEVARIASSYPHEISGGQAQKVLLAVAMLRAPKLLVCDEPTASLDGGSIDELVTGLRLLQERHGTAILLATHDMALVRAMSAKVLRHEAGEFLAAAGADTDWPSVDLDEPAETVLSVKGVHKRFGDLTVLRDLSLSVGRGELVAIVGPSGSGKTTLARILVGQVAADAGQLRCDGVQLLFQDAYLSLTPHRRIRSLVEETSVAGFDLEAEAEALGLPSDRLDHRPAELSGGERRRAALLRALSVEPPVLVLDEPTASLDHGTARSVMDLLLGVRDRRGQACVLITHDEAMARAVAHRVLRLVDGGLRDDASREEASS